MQQQVTELAGRMGALETGQAQLRQEQGAQKQQMAGYEHKVDDIHATVKRDAQTRLENNLLLTKNADNMDKILFLLKGQKEEGLEVPGLTERFMTMELATKVFRAETRAQFEALRQAVADKKLADGTRRGWLAGAIAVGGAVAAFIGTYFHDAIAALFHR